MHPKRAALVGVIGALAMTVLMLVLRAAGVSAMNFEMMLGSMFTAEINLGTWFFGLAIHLGFGALFGIAYALGMEGLRRQNAGIGLAFALVHTVASGWVLPQLMLLHPLVRSGRLENPGFLASSYGPGEVLVFAVLHLLYGAIVGALYRLHRRPALEVEAPIRGYHRPPTHVAR